MPKAGWGTLSWTQKLQLRGHTLLVTGVNTAWACSYHLDAGGKIEDERHLFLGERQLASLRDSDTSDILTLLIAHHPMSWLAGFNQAHIRHIINQHADIVLFGHSHTPHDLAVTLSATGAAAYLPAPATYDRAPVDLIELREVTA